MVIVLLNGLGNTVWLPTEEGAILTLLSSSFTNESVLHHFDFL